MGKSGASSDVNRFDVDAVSLVEFAVGDDPERHRTSLSCGYPTFMLTGAPSAKCVSDRDKSANVKMSRRDFVFIDRSSNEPGRGRASPLISLCSSRQAAGGR